jgi:uncharacterized delta-60 repeat protein
MLNMRTRACRIAATFLVGTLLGAPTSAAAPGDLDPSFGQGGHVLVQTNLGCLRICVEFGGSYADAVALQPDGGIVLGGYDSYIGAPEPSSPQPGALVGLLSNGALDSAFGSSGIENTPFRVAQIHTNAIGGLTALGSVEEARIGLARYTAIGAPDDSFAPQGVRWIPQPVGWQEEQGDPQGRIVVLVAVSPFQIDVVRYLASGAPDVSFGNGGYVRLSLPQTPREAAQVTPAALGIQRNGAVIVALSSASSTSTGDGPPRYFLERLTPSGRLDRGFGSQGIAHVADAGGPIAVAPNGHILLASSERAEERQEREQPRRSNRPMFGRQRLLLADYTSAGRRDRSFGNNGIARSQILTGPRTGITPAAIAFDAAGDAIVVGELPQLTVDVPLGTGFLARYTPHGRDCSFGAAGIVIDSETGGDSAVTVQPNGRIVVAGWSRKAFMAARYMGGGTPRTCRGEPQH